MNETIYPNAPSQAPGSTPETRANVPDTSMLPGTEKARPAAVGMLNQAVKGAHATIDRFAESAEPAVRKLGETVSAAEETLHEKTDQLRETRDAWTEGARTSIRCNPLASVAAAFALGAVIARITR